MSTLFRGARRPGYFQEVHLHRYNVGVQIVQHGGRL